MLLEVYKCVQLNRCSVVRGCVAEGAEGIGQMWASYAVSGLGRVRVGRIKRVGLVN